MGRRIKEETVLCYAFDIKIDWDGWPCYSCACNPKGENWAGGECTGCGYCHHESCPATGCIDCNEHKCEHEDNMGAECPDNCPRKKEDPEWRTPH